MKAAWRRAGAGGEGVCPDRLARVAEVGDDAADFDIRVGHIRGAVQIRVERFLLQCAVDVHLGCSVAAVGRVSSANSGWVAGRLWSAGGAGSKQDFDLPPLAG